LKAREWTIDSKQLALRIAYIAKEKKAEDVLVLDLRKVATFCEYFVITSGTSLRQVNALSDSIQEALAEEKVKPLSKSASGDESGWVVLDYSHVVVHLFYKPMREFYALEHLWSDAKRVRVPRKDPHIPSS
jgi:ribosome-associated protein